MSEKELETERDTDQPGGDDKATADTGIPAPQTAAPDDQQPSADKEPSVHGKPSSNTKATAQENPAEAANPSRLATALAIAALLVAILVGAGGVWLWQQIQQRQQAGSEDQATVLAGLEAHQQTLQQQLQQLTTSVSRQAAEQRARQQEVYDQLSAALQQQQQGQQANEAAVQQLRQSLGRQALGWGLAEVEYLLELAAHRLQFADDVKSARALLQAADQRVQRLGQVRLNGLREAIAQDVTLLQGIELPTISDMLLQLSALDSQVASLPLASAHYPVAPLSGGIETAGGTEAKDWREVLQALWQDLKKLVRIQRHDRPPQAMLPPEQQYFLYSNLRLRLQAARLALLQGDEAIYQQALHEVRAWLGEHFDDAAESVHRVDSALAELAARPVKVKLPKLGHGLRAVQQLTQPAAGN